MPTTTNRIQKIVASSALLLIVALACAAAKSLLLFVVVAYAMFACWYITKPEAPSHQYRRYRSSQSTDVRTVGLDGGHRIGQAFARADWGRSNLGPLDLDEISFDDPSDDFLSRCISIASSVTGYDEFGRDLSGRDIRGYDDAGYDTMGFDACGYDHAGHPEHEDHAFHDFIDSGNQIDTDWLSTPCWESV